MSKSEIEEVKSVDAMEVRSFSYKIKGLDCVACAEELNELISKIEGVAYSEVNFINMNLSYVLTDDADEKEVYDEVVKCCKKVDNTEIISEEFIEENVDDKPKKVEDEKKIKIVELSISLVFLIVGLIGMFSFPDKRLSMIFCVVAYSIAGYDVVYKAVVNLTNKRFFSEELLMTIASLGAIILGEVEEAAGVMLLYSIGELFNDYAVDNTRNIIKKLSELKADTVTIIENGKEVVIKTELAKVGDIMLVKAGERISLDGEILEGNASLDTAAITGESVYQTAGVGDEVFGGSLNVDGLLKVKITKPYSQSTVEKILEIVENSSAKKAKSEKFITKFSAKYTPIVVILALLLAFIPPIFSATYKAGLMLWGKRAIMLLCISCPCSLVLSVPLAYFCGVGTAAKSGILVKGTNYLETLSKVRAVAFDKTGTLTYGKPQITAVYEEKDFKNKLLQYAYIAEFNSVHPIAKAILESLKDKPEIKIDEYKEIAGKGVEILFAKEKILCGNDKLMTEYGVKFTKNEDLGSKLYVAVNGKFAGCIVLNDTVREDSHGVMLELYDLGVSNTVMLTGDNKEYAVKIRKELGMRQSVSELKPEQKVEEMQNIKNSLKDGSAIFVGDGINDAPVLSIADVGIAMGGLGSDIAVDSADVVILDDDLKKVPFLIKLAKRTASIAKQNIIASLLVKVIVMGFSISGLVTSLYFAIGADVGIMILAVLNSIRNKMKIY